MPSPSFLAFDLGASSSRAVLGTLEGDSMRMEPLHRFATPVLEEDGHLFWDLKLLWEELQRGLQMALDAAPRLRSLAVDSWAVDYVPLDEHGSPIRNPYCYRDPRTDGMMDRAFLTMPASEIYAHTGIQFLPFNTLYQLLADRELEPDAYRRTRAYLPIADYFNYRFSGRRAVDVSMASTTQLMDARTREWSDAVMRAFGFDVTKWPSIVPCGTRLGPVLTKPEVETVATCSHDTGCAVAAAPAVHERSNWAYISCGTWSLLGVERTTPLLGRVAHTSGFTNEAGIDGTIRFLKNLAGLWPLQECVREWNEAVDWEALEEDGRRTPPVRSTLYLEDPRFLPRGGMEDRIRDVCREHGDDLPQSRGQLVRLILESIAASYRRTIDQLEQQTGRRIETIYLFGGGSQNRLLCELTAAACKAVVVAGPAEATALGNLLIQARAMGDLPDGVTIRDAAARSCALETYRSTRD